MPADRGRLKALLAWLHLAMETYVERRALRRVSDVLLKDVGLSRADAERESGRRFWDLPERSGR